MKMKLELRSISRRLSLAAAVLALLTSPAFPQVKLSQINNGGNLASATDQLVGVRSGTTDELLTVGSACVENLTSIVIDNGAGGLTLGAGQVANAMLGNASTTVNGQACTLGSTCTVTAAASTINGLITAGTGIGLSGSGTSGSPYSVANNGALSFTGDGVIFKNSASTGAVTAALANQAANTVLGALTATAPSDLAVPSCSSSGNALEWTSGTGFGCATGYLTSSGAVTAFSAGTTGLTPNSATTGAVTLSGTLAAGNGGTGVANTATLTLGSSNQNWATLGTGIVKNTTTTGALTNAASADIISLFSTCSGTQYLGADGACHSAGGGSGLTVGTTTISSGTNTHIEYNNSGVLGEYAITGTGNVALSASPTFTGTVGAAAITATGLVTGADFNSTTGTTGYEIGGANALSFPADSTAGASVGIGSGSLINQTNASNTYQNTCIGYNTCSATPSSNNTLNTAIGYQAGRSLTSGVENTFIGWNAGQGVTSGSSNVAIGLQALVGGNGYDNVVVGHNAITSGSFSGQNDIVFGNPIAQALTSGSNNIEIGTGPGASTLNTGGYNILIGTSNSVDTIAGGTSNEINIDGLLYYNATSIAAPTVSSCGTSPAIDANANDRSGTVTVGTVAAASCTITFASAYASWNHCRVTSHSTIATFAYSYTLSAITLTGTSLVGDLVDYDCDGY